MKLLRSLRNPGSPVNLYLGWIVWSSALVSLYAAQGLGCSLGWAGRQIGPLDSLTLVLTALWLAHLALLAWLTLRAWQSPTPGEGAVSAVSRFICFGNRISQASATAATVWLGFPILLLHPCA